MPSYELRPPKEVSELKDSMYLKEKAAQQARLIKLGETPVTMADLSAKIDTMLNEVEKQAKVLGAIQEFLLQLVEEKPRQSKSLVKKTKSEILAHARATKKIKKDQKITEYNTVLKEKLDVFGDSKWLLTLRQICEITKLPYGVLKNYTLESVQAGNIKKHGGR